jgi:protein-tyrosine phosphatase
MVPLLRSAGGTTDGFSARSLSAAMARDADLVLTMTLDQRSVAVETCPAVVRRTFTLLEFARLLNEVDQEALGLGDVADRVRASVALVASKRRHVAGGPGFDDIADPYRGTEGQYRTAFEEIQRAVHSIATQLRAPGADRLGTTPGAGPGGDARP